MRNVYDVSSGRGKRQSQAAETLTFAGLDGTQSPALHDIPSRARMVLGPAGPGSEAKGDLVQLLWEAPAPLALSGVEESCFPKGPPQPGRC